jgi:hypothetical protein
LIRGATIWTPVPQGTLQNADLLVTAGKITSVGPGAKAPAARSRSTARRCTSRPGIIDCHSHIAISRGVNEATHAVTTEVRIGDVLDATDIDIYRQLGGGVTAANLLHGSANPMGGQNQVIKFRWGSLPEEMKLADAAPRREVRARREREAIELGRALHDPLPADANGCRAIDARSIPRRARIRGRIEEERWFAAPT